MSSFASRAGRSSTDVTAVTYAFRSYEFWLAFYRRVWRGTVVTSVVNPVLYLGALGVGLGTLVNKSSAPPGGVSYAHFVAPGLLAAAAMQIGSTESSWPVHGAFKWTRTYLAQAATPLGPGSILAGHQLFVLSRLVTSAAIYVAVIAAFGGFHSWLAVFALPAALLTGMAFSTPFAAYAATVESDHAFVAINRFAIVPMFLFSGTFFPVSRLPQALEWIAYATPLWQGVDLCRGLTLGTIGAPLAAVHVAYLLILTGAGLAAARVTYSRRLRT
jgi:lipooligosaccharide transport system permease protein